MNVIKKFKMTPSEFETPNTFYERITNFMAKKFGCIKDQSMISLKNALSYGWSICLDGNSKPIGLESNLYRDTICIGK